MTNTTMEDFSPKMFNKDASPQQTSASSSSGCFDCNICLDFAVDPVVTLCGHLYCWPCIYKWLQMEDRISPQSCPVCKAVLSEHSLVPLYGRGTPAKRHHHQAVAIPRRPSVRQHHHHLHLHDRSHEGELLSSSLPPRMISSAPAVGLLGEMVVAVLPWAFRNNQAGAAAMAGGLYYPNLYQQAGGGSPRLRRQEMQVEKWLNQMWMFLFCCAILCLLWF